jgi:hypothetical protein
MMSEDWHLIRRAAKTRTPGAFQSDLAFLSKFASLGAHFGSIGGTVLVADASDGHIARSQLRSDVFLVEPETNLEMDRWYRTLLWVV